MHGLKINFGDTIHTPSRLLLGEKVTNFGATVQNTLVLLGTNRGSDAVDAAKGTLLLKQATSGLLVDLNAMQHAANFAAIDTLFYVRSHPDFVNNDDSLDAITLAVADATNGRLALNASMTSNIGSVSGNATLL